MKKINKIVEILIILVLSLTPLIWFHDSSLLLGHDSGFRLDPSNHLVSLFYSWNSISNFGTDWTIFKGFLITQFPEFFFTTITNSIYWGQRLTLIFWFFSMAISMYIFLNEFFKEEKYWLVRLFSSLFYIYNFFILQAWFIAERSKFSIYAALPLGFLILYKTLTRRVTLIRGSIYFAIIFFFFNGGGNIPVFGGLLLTYTILLLSFLVEKLYRKQFTEIIFIGKTSMFFLFSAVVINFYWFLPQIFLALTSYSTKLSVNGGVGGILSWEGVISKNATLLNLFRLQGVPDWYDASHPFSAYYFNNPILVVLSCVPLMIVLFGFTFIGIKNNKKNEYTSRLLQIISVTFVVGFIFSGGTHPPLGFIYSWIITHIPGFAIFRSSYYKFSPTVFFSFSILIGYFLNAIFRKFIPYTKVFIASALFAIAVLLAYNFPFFITNFFLFNKPFTTKITLPNYVQETFTYINRSIDPNALILLAPELDPYIGEDSYTWGYWSLDILPRVALENPIIASDANTPIINNVYQALHKGDEKLFIQLAQKAGIHYILWRDDVLYNDKITTGKALLDEKKHLDSFTSLHVEHVAGPWELYALTQADSLFTTTPYVYTFQGEDPNIADLMMIAQEPSRQTTWITPNALSKINGVEGNIFESSCSTCDSTYIGDQAKQITIPPARILPWSKLYFLIQWKENRQLKQTAALPNQRIDVDLSLSNTRISEIWQMGYNFFSQRTPDFSNGNEKKYEALINDAITKINVLGNDDRVQYQGRIIAYLAYHKKYLEPALQNNQIKPTIQQMLSFIDKKISDLNQQLWISSTNDDKKSYITIPQAGVYRVHVISDVSSPYILFIDNNESDVTRPIFLSAGRHRTEVKYSSLDNLVNADSSNASLNVKKDKPLAYAINSFSYSSVYTIHFSYTLTPKTKVAVALYQNNAKSQLKGVQAYALKQGLIDDGEEHEFSFEYHPNRGIQEASIIFSSDKESKFQIHDFTVEETTNPRVYLTQNVTVQQNKMPSITYQKVNETKYIVSINDADNPYLLNFNQNYSNGWKIIPQTNEIHHVEVNGYSNGWLINKKGSYSLTIEYTPQNYFYLGSVISFITLGICTFFMMKRRNKK